MAMKITRNEAIRTLEVRDGVLLVVSDVCVPELSATGRDHLKVASVLDPEQPLRRDSQRVAGEALGPAARLCALYLDVLRDHDAILTRSLDYLEANGVDAYRAERTLWSPDEELQAA